MNSVSWGISYRMALITYFFITLLVTILCEKYRKYSKLFYGFGFLIFLISFISSRSSGSAILYICSQFLFKLFNYLCHYGIFRKEKP